MWEYIFVWMAVSIIVGMMAIALFCIVVVSLILQKHFDRFLDKVFCNGKPEDF